jgi:hypothetical protein
MHWTYAEAIFGGEKANRSLSLLGKSNSFCSKIIFGIAIRSSSGQPRENRF